MASSCAQLSSAAVAGISSIVNLEWNSSSLWKFSGNYSRTQRSYTTAAPVKRKFSGHYSRTQLRHTAAITQQHLYVLTLETYIYAQAPKQLLVDDGEYKNRLRTPDRSPNRAVIVRRSLPARTLEGSWVAPFCN